MHEQHWFDALNRELVRKAPRRAVLRSTAALAAGLLVGGAPDAEVGAAQARCGRARCRAFFTTRQDRNFCEVKCGRCKRAGTAFCIVRADDEHEFDRATCCFRGQKCCGGDKCCPSERCCSREDGTKFCVGEGGTCCPSDPVLGFCGGGTPTCCPPDGCVSTCCDNRHCGGCGRVCTGIGRTCIEGGCACSRPGDTWCEEAGRCIPPHLVCR